MVLSIIIPLLETDYEFFRCYYSLISFLNLERTEIIVVTPKKNIRSIAHLSEKIIIIEEKEKGIYSAMNQGIDFSRGKYLFFLGKDDIPLKGLKDIISILEKKELSILLSDVFYSTGKIYKNRKNRYYLLIRNWCHQGVIYNKNLFKNNKYNPIYRVQADHLFNIQAMSIKDNRKRIYKTKKPLSVYSNTGFSTITKDLTFWENFPCYIKNYYGYSFFLVLKLKRYLSI